MVQNNDIRIALRVTGRVQGVGYRWFVVAEARRLGLHGWVRNTADGNVELEAAGSTDAIATLREKLIVGPNAARVESVSDMPAGTGELPEGFVIVG
jgi:acylphosphatase